MLPGVVEETVDRELAALLVVEAIIPGVVEETLDSELAALLVIEAKLAGEFTALPLDSVLSAVVEAIADRELNAWMVSVVVAGLDIVPPCVLVTLLDEVAGIALDEVVVVAESVCIKNILYQCSLIT